LVATFFPQFLLGNAGMPRRYFNYDPRFQVLNVASTLGSWLLAAGMLVALAVLLHGLFHGKRAGDNPWLSRCFEWRTSSPPPAKNFSEPPDFSLDAYDYTTEWSKEEP
jgi:cytochrome c oxidase subunit 1